MNDIVGKYDILMITLDTLRYDVAIEEQNKGSLSNICNDRKWEKRHTPGSFTYAAHQAFFAGFLPTPADGNKGERLFSARFPGSETTGGNTYVFDSDNSILSNSITASTNSAEFSAYPNPANPSTQIAFSVENPGKVSLILYNVLGQQVRVLTNEFHAQGEYRLTWDGRDFNGISLTSGVYIAQLKVGDRVKNMRIFLAK